MGSLTRLTKNRGGGFAFKHTPPGAAVKYQGNLKNKDARRRELDIIAEHALILGVLGGTKENGNKDERKADGPIA
jgi:hypothetical protein